MRTKKSTFPSPSGDIVCLTLSLIQVRKQLESMFPSPSGDIVCLTKPGESKIVKTGLKFPSPSGDIVCLTLSSVTRITMRIKRGFAAENFSWAFFVSFFIKSPEISHNSAIG